MTLGVHRQVSAAAGIHFSGVGMDLVGPAIFVQCLLYDHAKVD